MFVRTRTGDAVEVIASATGMVSEFVTPTEHELRLLDARILRAERDDFNLLGEFAEFRLSIPAAVVTPPPYKSKSASSMTLAASDNADDRAEFQWRLSTGLSALLLALLAVPLSHSLPRQGRYAKVMIAVAIYAAAADTAMGSCAFVYCGDHRLRALASGRIMIRAQLDRYLVSSMLKALVPVVLMLLALFSFLALAEELEDVGEGRYVAMDAVAVVGLTLPNRLLDLLPVMLLLGALIGLGGLAGNSELTAARAAGRSPWQLMRPPLLTALVVGLVLLGSAVEIYSFDDEGLLSVRQVAMAEVIGDKQWQLKDVHVLSAGVLTQEAGEPTVDAPQNDLPAERWQIDLAERRMAVLALPAASLSLVDLRRRILRGEDNELDVHGLRVLLWQRLSLPLAAIAMVLLALPFVFGSTRVLSVGERVTFGVIAGVVFYLLEQSSAHFAVIYRLNPVVMAILPECLILLVVGNWLRRFD